MPTYERHILLVDPDPSFRANIRDVLEPRGVKVTDHTDGQAALDAIQAGLRPDVIISDLEMPQMDGFKFFSAVRQNDDWIAIPFILLCSKIDKANRRQALMLGVDDFLDKPVDVERLILTIYNRTKRIQELTRYAEAAHEALGYIRRDMARMFTHELRTPLVSLNMVMEILTRQGADLNGDDADEMMDTLQSGLARLNRLVEQMVLLIQLDTGELQKLIKEARRPGPLWDALTAAVSQARSFTYRQRDIEVIYNHGDVSGDITAEWKTLRHALAEVLSNAMAFSPKDQPVLVSQWLENDMIVLRITDQGPGIPDDKRSDLFRRFNQVEREKHDQQGIGMGLYLARNIVETTGGRLDLDTREGEGTTVKISFPRVN
jgi:two-component system sensor histidine kinase/response regulator